MKKTFQSYLIIWASLLALYNLIVFVVRPIPGFVIRYDERFWITWIVVIATYGGQLYCAHRVFNAQTKDDRFLRAPLIFKSYSFLISATLVGSILMLIPDCPEWIAAIVSVALLVFHIITIVKIDMAGDAISEVSDRVKDQTLFIRSMTMEADSLIPHAKDEASRVAVKKVYEAFRLSEPRSVDALSGIESQITIRFNQFATAVTTNNGDVTGLSEELIILINDRNKRCIMLK